MKARCKRPGIAYHSSRTSPWLANFFWQGLPRNKNKNVGWDLKPPLLQQLLMTTFTHFYILFIRTYYLLATYYKYEYNYEFMLLRIWLWLSSFPVSLMWGLKLDKTITIIIMAGSILGGWKWWASTGWIFACHLQHFTSDCWKICLICCIHHFSLLCFLGVLLCLAECPQIAPYT